MQHKHHIHYDQNGHMCIICDTSIISLPLKTILFHYGLLLLYPSQNFHYGHSEDSVCENISVCVLTSKVFLFSKMPMCDFRVISSSMNLCQCAILLLTTNLTFCQIYIRFEIAIKRFLDVISFI